MKLRYLLAAGAVGGLSLALIATRRGAAAAAPSALPAPATNEATIGEPLVAPGTELAPPQAAIGSLLQKGGSAIGGAAVGQTIGLGLKLADVSAAGIKALGGNEAQATAARIFGPVATVGVLTQLGTQKLGEQLGLSQEAAKHVAQTTGLAVPAAIALGAPAAIGVAITKGLGEAGSAVIGAVFGEKAERDVRDALSSLDPFKNGSPANKVFDAIGGLFGGGAPKVPPPPLNTANDVLLAYGGKVVVGAPPIPPAPKPPPPPVPRTAQDVLRMFRK